MRSTPAAGALLTGLTTLTAVAGCVAVSPDTGTGPGTRPAPGTAWPVPGAPGPAAASLPGHELLATIGPAPRPRRVTPPSRKPGSGTARPDTPAADGPPPAPPARTPAPRPAPARPVRTAPPAAPPTPAASGAAVDPCALAGDYGRWAPGSREAVACAEYFER